MWIICKAIESYGVLPTPAMSEKNPSIMIDQMVKYQKKIDILPPAA